MGLNMSSIYVRELMCEMYCDVMAWLTRVGDVKRHRINTLNMVKESMDKGWQTWSAQAAELQLLRADRENRKAQGQGFFKMSDDTIAAIQEDIAKDLYEKASRHKEEASQIMQEFDKHDINTSVHLDNLAAEQQRQTLGLGVPEPNKPRTSTEDKDNDDEDNEDDDEEDENETDNDTVENEGNNCDQQHEPSLFDILEDDAEDEIDNDPHSDQQK